MKKNINKQLLNEELKRFKLLLEYDFYQEEKEEDKDVILGSLEEQEPEQEPESEPSTELTPEQPIDTGVEQPDDIGVEEPVDGGDDMDMDMDMEQPIDSVGEEDVEIDVTELVKGSEEAKRSAEEATRNTETLLSKLADLESRIEKMDNITSKIDDLEREIVKRNPTPVEKLELRSLSSFPYNQKLTDFWGQKHDGYEVTSDDKKEYTLTTDDIDYAYSDNNVRQSFSVDDNLYEEEDI